MQVDVRQEWRNHRALGCALGRRYPASVLYHASFEPLANQPEQALIGYPLAA